MREDRQSFDAMLSQAASADDSHALSGGCQCGAVRYRVSGLSSPTICHCRMCQKAVGGPFAALVVCENVTYTRGEPAYFESSNKVRRGFCSACGTPLTYEFEGGNLDITICSLDTPATVAPQEQLGTADRLPWCDGLSTLPERSGDTATAAQALFATIISHQHPDHDTPNQDTPNNTQA